MILLELKQAIEPNVLSMINQLTNFPCGYVDRFLFERDIGFKWIDNR